MSKKNGFTLIELLAVIIILGILMIIAIPSVTRYISDSRKSAYVDTAKQMIGSARNLVNSGNLEMYDTDTTYYIDYNCITTENAAKSPYDDFDLAYVVVTYDGKGYTYYWTSIDKAKQGIKNIIRIDKLDTDNVESDLDPNDISTLRGIDGRSQTIVVSKANKCQKEGPNDANSQVNGETGEETKPICKRATTLHTATCSATYRGCYSLGYYVGGSKNTSTITYGKLWDGTSPLSSGDALDCDVTGTGNYERFYYVSSSFDPNTLTYDDSKAVLIYYANIQNDGTTISKPSQTTYIYNGTYSHFGPNVGYQYLPSTTQWSHSQIIQPSPNRQLRNEDNGTTSSAGWFRQFTYTDKAARFLTLQEMRSSCSNAESSDGLDECVFYFENIGAFEKTSGAYGFWLETPFGRNSNYAWRTDYRGNYATYHDAWQDNQYGVRPTIEVLKSNISRTP